MKRLLLIISFFNFVLMAASAQKFTANAPQQVAVGEQFRLTYTVTSQDVSGFRIGQIPSEAFEVLMGPSTSTQSYFSMVNGQTSQTSRITYTYILSALKNGTFTIPAASINIEGNPVKSNAVKIEVVGTAQQGGGNRHGRRSQQQDEMRAAGSAISGSDLFIKVSASKKKVYEQEPVLLTYKVYTLVSLTQLEGKMPDLKGFHTQEIPLPQEKSFKIEQFNGRNYKTVTWSQYVMFPQMSGKLQVPPLTFNGIVVQQNRNIDPFEAFFNGGSGYVEVKKQIKAPGVDIEVEPLPTRPAGFSGGVGSFQMKSSIDNTQVKANEPLTIRVTISGIGNMKLIKTPAIDWPEGFEPYDPKVTNNFKTTTAGVSGTKSIEYLAIPRSAGEYNIPAVKFSYFDIEEKVYKTLSTPEYTIRVKRGANEQSTVSGEPSAVVSYTQKEDIKQLGTDIRYIDTKPLKKQKSRQLSDLSYQWMWLWYVIPLMISAILLVIMRKQIKEASDLTRVRYKRANKVAKKRLKAAEKALKANDKEAFYAAIEQAAWTYLSDRLSIPTADLNKDNITALLTQKGVSETLIAEVKNVLSTAEFARYAPTTDHAMDELYTATTNLINNLEEEKI